MRFFTKPYANVVKVNGKFYMKDVDLSSFQSFDFCNRMLNGAVRKLDDSYDHINGSQTLLGSLFWRIRKDLKQKL